jgi:hypothetical protein
MHHATVLPLHYGKAPRWLYGRMVKLGRAISLVIMDQFGTDELLTRLSDTNWFQAFACAIGYDWHSSGTTTVTLAALKEALNDSSEIYIAGGKGKQGLKTPEEIRAGVDVLSIPGEAEAFEEYSRIAAKVDSCMVYDNIGIYQHSFLFTRSKRWAVIQQAMDTRRREAIRFQWLSDLINKKDVADEPHMGIQTQLHKESADLTYSSNEWARHSLTDALQECDRVIRSAYPDRHEILKSVDIGERARKAIRNAAEINPKDYRELLLTRGIGRSTIRSLAFVASLIFDKELAYRDPVMFSYNLGGKDGIPFPVNRSTYDSVIESMDNVIDAANIEKEEKIKAMKRLSGAMRCNA